MILGRFVVIMTLLLERIMERKKRENWEGGCCATEALGLTWTMNAEAACYVMWFASLTARPLGCRKVFSVFLTSLFQECPSVLMLFFLKCFCGLCCYRSQRSVECLFIGYVKALRRRQTYLSQSSPLLSSPLSADRQISSPLLHQTLYF